MVNKQALIVVLASSAVTQTTRAFGVGSDLSIHHRPVRQALHESSCIATDLEPEHQAIADRYSLASQVYAHDVPVNDFVTEIPLSVDVAKPKSEVKKAVNSLAKQAKPEPEVLKEAGDSLTSQAYAHDVPVNEVVTDMPPALDVAKPKSEVVKKVVDSLASQVYAHDVTVNDFVTDISPALDTAKPKPEVVKETVDSLPNQAYAHDVPVNDFVMDMPPALHVAKPKFEELEKVVDSVASQANAHDVPVNEFVTNVPPSPDAAKLKLKVVKKAVAKKKGNPHKEGVFSPIVVAAGSMLGRDELIKIRAKVIAVHSDIIKSFVDTSDSTFGKAVLKELFTLVDTDKSGCLDKEELSVALNLLGFKWLDEKQVNKIFNKADANGDQVISLDEFMIEAPKTLKVNLIKLAKTNGGEMGLMV